QVPLPRVLESCINALEWDGEAASAGVVKDAGDDPDVTHGAEIFATVRRVSEPGIHLRGGVGVGVVTQRGLELPVGSPAINPVPQRMIREAILDVVRGQESGVKSQESEPGSLTPDSCLLTPGFEVTVSVPNGEELARRTFNARIGIVGGISILGTTGIVRALSTAAWRASVLQAIDVAAADGGGHLLLSTRRPPRALPPAPPPPLPPPPL